MPLYDAEGVRALVGRDANGEHTLDLRGDSLLDAQAAITQLLEEWRVEQPTSVVVRIDPATATSGETLFLPIGRQLLQARKRGLITHMHTLPEADGGGFFISLPGRSEQGKPE